MDAAIEAEGLVKHFGEVRAVDGVDLRVAPGTVYGVLGPNGAGKTTVVRMLTTTLRPTAGRATVLGIDVAAHPARVRAVIGLAGQYAAVDEHLTGRENLRLVGKLTHLPAEQIRRRSDELLALFSLADAADRPTRTYSGGMRRRLDLAASLVHAPPVLFLDEPTTGLDPASRKDLWGVIEGLVGEGTTVLLTTQYLEEADRLAQRIAVIDRGLVIAEGTSAELKAQLGSTVVELSFADRDARLLAATALAGLGPADAPVASALQLTTTNGPALLGEALRVLTAEGIEPTAIAVREPSLDDVFLALTGHTAEERP
ncbi:MAG: ATP-binding cassette domain-containing protein [Acidimicrobiales bacterium]